MSKYKASIIGCGKIAGSLDNKDSTNSIFSHASGYDKHKLFEIKSICDRSLKNLQHFSLKWEVDRCYQDLDEMLNKEKPHVLSICTPNKYHFEHIMIALNSKWVPKVIFLEKPCCDNKDEFIKISNKLKDSDTAVLVNHTRRFCPGHNQVKQIIDSGLLGKLLRGSIDYYGDWINNGCHIIDTLKMFFNNDIEIKDLYRKNFDDEKKLFLDLNIMLNDAEISIKVNDERFFQLYESHFIFEKGRVQLLDFGEKIIIETAKTNNWNENILSEINESPIRGLESPIYHAVDIISKFLDGNIKLDKTGALFNQTKHTMNILWNSKNTFVKGEKYDN